MTKTLTLASLLLCMVAFGAFGAPKTAPSSTPIRVATYNLRLNTEGDKENAWPKRSERVKALIRYHDFDLFGTQEGFVGQLQDLLTLGNYAYVGVGRDDGKEAGEHSAIFYRKDRFEVLDHGDFWLSETPEVPSYGWGANFRRICTWAKLKDLNTKQVFYFMSVHFDHETVPARRESAKMMLAKAKEFAGDTYPIFAVGDYNATPDDEPIQIMLSGMKSAYDITQEAPYGPVGTFSGFQVGEPQLAHIDHIFVNDKVRVLRYGVLTDSDGLNYPSDHRPVVIDAILSK